MKDSLTSSLSTNVIIDLVLSWDIFIVYISQSLCSKIDFTFSSVELFGRLETKILLYNYDNSDAKFYDILK